MRRYGFAILCVATLLTLPLFAQDYTITPASGPASGGTEVTIKGSFPAPGYGVLFGGAGALTNRVDATTLVAITPKHLPGPVDVDIVSLNGTFLATRLTFTYVGDVPTELERVLLPIFIPATRGQFNSEFITRFSAYLQRGESATLNGLQFGCAFICPPIPLPDLPVQLTKQGPEIDSTDVKLNGNPGRFVYIAKTEIDNVAMHLRVYDRSRSSQNFGTELPIVRANNFANDIMLLDVPTDPRFRNALRIYAAAPARVVIRIESDRIATVETALDLNAGSNIFEPAIATFTNFPTNVGTVRVRISQPTTSIWAFIAVTNNDTQMITTITPQW